VLSDRRSLAARATRRAFVLLAAGAIIATSMAAQAQDKSIVVASTTSTQDSGLFGHILPLFKKKTGIDVRVVSQGTGQALETGRRGDADVVFVHARAQEEKFVADGHGVRRFPVMYNDFVLIGPKSDPAKVGGTKDIVAALKKIKEAQAAFISRGDKSGTHAAELNLWKAAGIDPHPIPPPHSPSKTGVNALSLGEGWVGAGPWYKEIGQGMGAALNTASASNAYVLADRGTWLSFKNRGPLVISVEGDKRLFNQYGVMLVNPQKHKHVKAKEGQAFIDWLVSKDGQQAIAAYKIGGQQLFFLNAAQPGA
jgi:tungstate transport system substrate-binding protein